MRILHVIAGAEVGGAETFARDAICGLAARGVAQTVVCRPYAAAAARFAAAGVATVPLRFSWLDRLGGASGRIRRLAGSFRADLVHAWMSRGASFVPPGMPCPVIGWFGDNYDLKYFRAVDACVGVTPDIVRWTLRHGEAPHRAFLVNTFGTMPDSAPVSRRDLGVPEGAAMLLVLSRLHPVKGIDTMLRALAEVPGAFLCIAGEGPARAEYEALSAQLGLAERVRFLGWRDDRKALLEACDICVLPSRYEPFGTVILEAWAARRPLVASRADGARQYVEDGRTGLVCPIDDAPALAACLRRVVENRDGIRERLAAAGHRRYADEFTQEKVLDRLLEVYRTVRDLGRRGQDASVAVAILDRAARARLAAGLSGVLPAEARGRAADVAAVALAYSGADRAAAAMLQARGPGSFIRHGRVAVAPALHLARAAAELPAAGAEAYAPAADWLSGALT